MKNLIVGEQTSYWKTFMLQLFFEIFRFLFVPTVHFTLTQRGRHFVERPIAALKGERTVKGTVISRVNLSFVITRNGFCAETKPTFHFAEQVFIGKTPLPQEAERPFFNDLPTPHCAERPMSV